MGTVMSQPKLMIEHIVKGMAYPGSMGASNSPSLKASVLDEGHFLKSALQPETLSLVRLINIFQYMIIDILTALYQKQFHCLQGPALDVDVRESVWNTEPDMVFLKIIPQLFGW